MSGAGLRWERMTHGTEFAYSGTVCVGSARTLGMCAWRCEVSGTGGTAVSPAEARAAVEAEWGEWRASTGLVPAGEADGWRPIETVPDAVRDSGAYILAWGNWCEPPCWEKLLARWDAEDGWCTLDTQTCSTVVAAEVTHWLPGSETEPPAAGKVP